MKVHANFCRLILLLIVIGTTSCKEDEPTSACKKENTGTVIITNNYEATASSSRSIIIFINRDPLSSNSSGDLSVAAGETGSITLPSGIHAFKVYLNTGSCSGNRCSVSREYLGEREVDLDQCEELNLAYGG